jgi:hypothetical protein
MFCQLASPAKVLFLISGPTGVVSELHRLLRGTIENFIVAVVSPLEYIRVQQVETFRKLGSQAVHRTDS